MGKFGRFVLKAVLAFAMLAVLLLCGISMFTGEKHNGNGNQNEADYLITVGFSQSGEDTSWKAANTESFMETFIEENGYELIFSDAGTDQEKQLADVEHFIERNVDYIILNPVVETGWDEVLEEAKKARIPVILINNRIDEEESSLYQCWIGSDYEKQTREAGKWLAKYLEEKDRENEDITMAAIQGSIGTPEQMERAEGYQSMLEKHGKWNMRAQLTGEGTREDGKEVMELFLENYHKLEVVFAESDEMALGAIEAVREAGMSCGPDGDIILISFGGSKEGLQAIVDGKLNVTFEKNPVQAPKVAEIVQKLDAGVSIDRIQYVDEGYYDNTMELEKIIDQRTY